MLTISENLKELNAAETLLYLLPDTDDPITMVQGQQGWWAGSPDVSVHLQYLEPITDGADQPTLNCPTISLTFKLDDYTKLHEYISWLIELTIELVAETTNNDPIGWSLEIQTRSVPEMFLQITVNDFLS